MIPGYVERYVKSYAHEYLGTDDTTIYITKVDQWTYDVEIIVHRPLLATVTFAEEENNGEE